MRLRQVAIAVQDLDRAVEDIRAVLGVRVCFTPEDEMALRGPELIDRFSLSNAVFAVSDTFLELVTPTRPDTTIARFLARRGDGGYMVLVQCDDLERARERCAEAGVREAYLAELPDLRGVHLDPRDTGGALLSLDQPDEPADWPWAGADWRSVIRTELTTEIVGARIAAAHPTAVAQRWAELLDRAVRHDDSGTPTIFLDRGYIRVEQARDGDADGLCGVDVRCPDPDKVRGLARQRAVPIDVAGRPVLAGVPFALLTGG